MQEPIKIDGHITQTTSLPAAVSAWEIFLRDQNKSEYTIKAFKGDLGLLMEFLPPDISLGDITHDDLTHFIEWLENGRGRNIPCSEKSLSRRITTLKSFFRWLFNNGRIAVDPADRILQRSVVSPLPEVLSSLEVEKVLSAAKNMAGKDDGDPRPYLLVKLLLETGIKKSECLYLKMNHVFISNGDSYIFVRYPDLKDRNKERKIQLTDDWKNYYQKYLSKYEITDAVFPWSPRRLEYLLEEIGTKAGLEKHLSFSMCRWISALIDLEKGIEKDLIRQKLGVSKIQWREISSKLEKLTTSPVGD